MHTYDQDIVAWANEQAALLRSGNFAALDLVHLAEEIEDVGKSEQRELASRMAVLLAHLLKWQLQPELRGASWERTIKEQRKGIKSRLAKSPGLQPVLIDEDWQAGIWADAVAQAASETGLADFPEERIWTGEQILDSEFFPGSDQKNIHRIR